MVIIKVNIISKTSILLLKVFFDCKISITIITQRKKSICADLSVPCSASLKKNIFVKKIQNKERKNIKSSFEFFDLLNIFSNNIVFTKIIILNCPI